MSPEKYLGYFLLKNINDSLGCKRFIDLMQTATNFRFNIFDMMSALIYARTVQPCSKSKLMMRLSQISLKTTIFTGPAVFRSGVHWLRIRKVIEIYNHQINQTYPLDTAHTYFDCTNFYFEIDKEDDFRLKGPSKENRREPIVGMGLLLDANQIPIGMKMYPGNESENLLYVTSLMILKTQSHIRQNDPDRG